MFMKRFLFYILVGSNNQNRHLIGSKAKNNVIYFEQTQAYHQTRTNIIQTPESYSWEW